MGRVADALREWADEHELAWKRRDEALRWAEAQGDDLRRAWETCPRADDLMALAGALQAPMKSTLVAAGRLVRPALALATKRDAPATRAVYLAETWGASTERAVKAASEQLQAHVTREGARYRGARDRLSEAGTAALGELVASEFAGHGERLGAHAASDDRAWVDVEVERVLMDPASLAKLRAFGAKVGAAQREMARVAVLAAALELCRAVESAHAALRALATLAQLEGDERAAVTALLGELAKGAAAAECEVFGLASGAFGLAAEAWGRDAVGRWCAEGEGFLREAARAVFETAEHALERPSEPLPTLSIHVAIDRAIEVERARRLAVTADAVRAAIPWDSLARRG